MGGSDESTFEKAVPRRYNVFISYSWADDEFVDWLCVCLESAGLKLFRDKTSLEFYDKFDNKLKENIAASDYVLSVISPAYLSSYWCMFEAIEAIGAEDFEQRFLPVRLRYSPDDQAFDEDFVLARLDELTEESRKFEQRMIRAQAYELSSKLEKIAFVRSALPKLFARLQQRLFPEFRTWSDDAAATALGLIAHIAPGKIAGLPVDTWPAAPLHPIVKMPPRQALNPMPRIAWRARVGHCGSRNSPLAVGNQLFVTSAGDVWNEPDPADGIRCLDADTGELRWFAPTPADANALLVTKGIAITGCDDGSIIAVSAEGGSPIWQQKLDSGITGGPIRLPRAHFGRRTEWDDPPERDTLCCVTHDGGIHVLDLFTGERLQSETVGGTVVAPPLVRSRAQDPRGHGIADGTMFVLTTNGVLHRIPVNDGYFMRAEAGRYGTLSYAGSTEEPVHFSTSPIMTRGALLAGFARDTEFADPPLLKIDPATFEQIWAARDADRLSEGYGNLRGAPYIVDDYAIVACAYSDGVTLVSLETGAVVAHVPLGLTLFEQWPSVTGEGAHIFVARHDGYLHCVNVPSRRREWSLFLGANDRAGTCIASDQRAPEFDDPASWSAHGSAPLLSTPLLDRRRLYVGSSEGWLYCIDNLGI